MVRARSRSAVPHLTEFAGPRRCSRAPRHTGTDRALDDERPARAAALDGRSARHGPVASGRCRGLPSGFLWPKTEASLAPTWTARPVLPSASTATEIWPRWHCCGFPTVPPELHPRFPLVPNEDWPRRACGLESTVVSPAARGAATSAPDRRPIGACRLDEDAVGLHAGVRLENAVSWATCLPGAWSSSASASIRATRS